MLTGWQWVIVILAALSATTALVALHQLPGEVVATLAGSVVALFARPGMKGTGDELRHNPPTSKSEDAVTQP